MTRADQVAHVLDEKQVDVAQYLVHQARVGVTG
jgi:hypothetical protein